MPMPIPSPSPTPLRGPEVGTTSSSSAASAEEPRIPFGLGDRRLLVLALSLEAELEMTFEVALVAVADVGERRLGDPEPEPDFEDAASSPAVVVGRAIGAIDATGRVIGPGTTGVEGPAVGSTDPLTLALAVALGLSVCNEVRLPVPGANIGAPDGPDPGPERGVFVLGGPIGVGGTLPLDEPAVCCIPPRPIGIPIPMGIGIPRLKDGSKPGPIPPLNPCGIAEGANGVPGGGC